MKKALLVGLNDYPDCELNWCDNDAIAMKDLIETNGDGSPNFDAIAILGSCAKDELLSSIKDLFDNNVDVALLYFSGHGAEADGGYLCTTDFSGRDLGVRMTDVLNIANTSKCKNKILKLPIPQTGIVP